MSKTLTLLLSMLLLCGCDAKDAELPTSPNPAVGHPLVEGFRKAVDSKEVDAMMDLVCWDGVDAESRDMYRKSVEKAASLTVTTILYRPASFKKAPDVKRDGKSYHLNLPLTGWLIIMYEEWGFRQRYIPFGKKGDRTLITIAVPTP
jgi:hypothetical protein